MLDKVRVCVGAKDVLHCPLHVLGKHHPETSHCFSVSRHQHILMLVMHTHLPASRTTIIMTYVIA